MLKSVNETKDSLILKFETKADRKIPNPKIKAASEFYKDLVQFIAKRYKIPEVSPDINFMNYADIKEVFAITDKGETFWLCQAELTICKKEAVKATTSNKKQTKTT